MAFKTMAIIREGIRRTGELRARVGSSIIMGVTPNTSKKKDSIEGVVLNQQPSTTAKWKIVRGNMAL
jgi:hypothetical protein